ncbi:hypothetical protein SDC9_137577 [bioreactor metagenome]|uniref:Uncharacterized protein n=1 Tax=bioreactor metagenome TaxID=1076179 RepID=A0A645DMA3_9ZZZZ|nr:hypothetical protein [Candidatus Pelethousia sp.]
MEERKKPNKGTENIAGKKQTVEQIAVPSAYCRKVLSIMPRSKMKLDAYMREETHIQAGKADTHKKARQVSETLHAMKFKE